MPFQTLDALQGGANRTGSSTLLVETREAHDEARRLTALHRAEILDTPPEPEFDRLAHFAATLLQAPTALVSLVDEHRQWFKARVGMDVCETPRAVSFCSVAIRQSGLFEITDAAADPRFRSNPLVTDKPGIRYYAGVPLTASGGERLGTICVIDYAPRPAMDARHRSMLTMLAAVTMREIELRHIVQAASARSR